MIKVNGVEVKLSKFPNGETLVDTEYLNTLKGDVDIHFKWKNDEDLIHLCFILDHLSDLQIENMTLYIYYMPYSRMDRNQNGNCFTLATLAHILSPYTVLCDDVWVLEPHSNITTDLLVGARRFNVITPLMQHILRQQKVDVICYPDKGAKARFQDDAVDLPVVYCNKVRDFDTGEIKGLELVGDINLADKNVLILDDLSSKGGTFYFTSKKLKEAGAKDVFLGVCHAEDSIMWGKIWTDGISNSDTPIKHIYCLDTMLGDRNIAKLGTNITVFRTEKVIDDLSFESILEEDKCLLNS